MKNYKELHDEFTLKRKELIDLENTVVNLASDVYHAYLREEIPSKYPGMTLDLIRNEDVPEGAEYEFGSVRDELADLKWELTLSGYETDDSITELDMWESSTC